MNTTLLLILIAISALVIGFIIGNLLSKLKFKQQTTDLEKEIAALQNHQANFEFYLAIQPKGSQVKPG